MDGQLRHQFSHRWNRRPSEQLTVNFRRDADSIRRFLQDADLSNLKVRKELETAIASKFDLLALTRDQLDAKLPRATQEQSQASQQSVAELRTLLGQLNDNASGMKKMLEEFELQLQTTDLMAVLVARSNSAQSSLDTSAGASSASSAQSTAATFEHELAPFTIFDQRFIEFDHQQTELLRSITVANEQFHAHRSQDDTTRRREAFLQELNVATTSFTKLLANFNEGLKFYADLTQQKISPFVQRIGDFVMARDMESKLILGQLTRDAAQFKEDEADEKRQASVFPNASAHNLNVPQAAGIYAGGPPVSPIGAGVSSVPGGPSSAASTPSGAANPNLSFEPPSNLYSLQSPTGAGAANGSVHGALQPTALPPSSASTPAASPAPSPSGYGNPFQSTTAAPPSQSFQSPQQHFPPQPQAHPYQHQQQQQQHAPYQSQQQFQQHPPSNPYATAAPHQQPQYQQPHYQSHPQPQYQPQQPVYSSQQQSQQWVSGNK